MGASKSTIANYERGDRTPDADSLMAYRDRWQVDLNWLVTGEGAMFTGQGAAEVAAEVNMPRLERAIALIEQVLDEDGLELAPAAKAQAVAAAYSLLVPGADETPIKTLLRLVKG
jgi:transcriptional regulator with XRE-family HTH domain